MRVMRRELLAIYGVLGDPLKQCYKVLTKKHHPDKGGDEDNFKALNDAYDALQEELDQGINIGAGVQDDQDEVDGPMPDASVLAPWRSVAQYIREGMELMCAIDN